MKTISIIIPTFNESENIVKLIRQILKIKSVSIQEVIVVDDDSPDKTGYIVKKVFHQNDRVVCYVRKGEPDLGKSILMGIEHARGDVVVGMDGDFNHDVRIIPTLIDVLSSADLVVASRFVTGGGMQKKTRYWISYFFNLVLKNLFRFPIIDNTSGYYAVSAKKLHSLDLKSIYHGYGEYCLRLLFYAKQMGFHIKTVPVYYTARSYGVSKSHFFRMVYTYTYTAILLNLTSKTKVQ
ncbi:MAG: glycosyltransferase [Candidatus Roizmanbacteria bacterium]|nr:glycosyltransferase [Candidatus Roizmanbacteria bacterium]